MYKHVVSAVAMIHIKVLIKKMDFVLNHMELSVDFVAKDLRLLSMSLEKVMRPRFFVLQNKRAMDGAGEDNPTQIFLMFMMPKVKFFTKIIQGHLKLLPCGLFIKMPLLMS